MQILPIDLTALILGALGISIVLVPVIGIVQVGSQAMADRYTYIPLTGLIIVLAWGGYDLLARRSTKQAPLAATAVLHVLAGDLEPGAAGLAGTEDTVSMLRTLATRGVKPVRFEGVSTFV